MLSYFIIDTVSNFCFAKRQNILKYNVQCKRWWALWRWSENGLWTKVEKSRVPSQVRRLPKSKTNAFVQCDATLCFTEAQYIPSQHHEETRRKIANGVTELWFYLRSELNKAAERLRAVGAGAGDGVLTNLKTVLEDGADMQRYVIWAIRYLHWRDTYFTVNIAVFRS